MWKMALLGENMDVAQEAGNALVQLHLHLGPGLQQRMASVRKSFVGWVPACCTPAPHTTSTTLQLRALVPWSGRARCQAHATTFCVLCRVCPLSCN